MKGDFENKCFVDGLFIPSSGVYLALTLDGILCSFQNEKIQQWVNCKIEKAYCLSLNGENVVCGGSSGTIRVFLADTFEFVCNLPQANQSSVIALSFTPSHLFAFYSDKSVFAYSTKTWKIERDLCEEG